MQALEAVMRARELLQTLTPLRRDCGGVCGAACCAPDEDGQGGMLLFPGEEALYQPLPAGFSLRQDDGVLPGMLLLTCGGVCDRALRPLACRMFPLTPVLSVRDGRERQMETKLLVRDDIVVFSAGNQIYAECPLCEGGVRGMDATFAQAVLQSARILNECPEHQAYFRALGRYFERLRSWN